VAHSTQKVAKQQLFCLILLEKGKIYLDLAFKQKGIALFIGGV